MHIYKLNPGGLVNFSSEMCSNMHLTLYGLSTHFNSVSDLIDANAVTSYKCACVSVFHMGGGSPGISPPPKPLSPPPPKLISLHKLFK